MATLKYRVSSTRTLNPRKVSRQRSKRYPGRTQEPHVSALWACAVHAPAQSREACLHHGEEQPVKSQLLRKPGSTPSVPILNHLLDGISWPLNNFPCRNAVHHGLVQPPNNARYERHFGARGPQVASKCSPEVPSANHLTASCSRPSLDSVHAVLPPLPVAALLSSQGAIDWPA